jgi:two-component sensor histidine kinase
VLGDAAPTARPKRRLFPGRPDQIAQARNFTRRVLGSCPVADDAALLVSELATNAMAHTATGTGGHFHVTIYPGDASLLIAVTDEWAEAGRGLGLVELIAERWGHCGNERSRTIWFELRWKEP